MPYNKSRGGLNWVNWHVARKDFGDADSQDLFPEDAKLHVSWRINKSSYIGSGFAKGHLYPSEDRKNTQAANDETFLMLLMAIVVLTNCLSEPPPNEEVSNSSENTKPTA